MFARRSLWLISIAAGIVAALSTVTALAGSNSVPSSRVSDRTYETTVAQFIPSECSGITPTIIINGTDGENTADLLLATAATDSRIHGRGGDDCIMAGAGDDFLQGDSGQDVCVGGPGTDTFHNSCETKIQ